ncbi:MAG: hypothetical protein V3V92_03195, partial [Candidatus Hydrothermarchaeales archaeon]
MVIPCGRGRRLLCLGIESTAEKLGVGVVSSDGTVLANVIKRPTLVGGIHPREAALHHADNIVNAINEVLEKADLSLDDMELVAFSQGPGMGPCLRVSAISARAISLANEIPIIGVNHCIGHIEIGRLETKAQDPLTTYVSG